MSNKDLLKQAIAEAKTIREAAIANAKEALEESLTPHLKDMLAQKLQEMEEAEEEVMNEEDMMNDPETPTAHGNVAEVEEEGEEAEEEEGEETEEEDLDLENMSVEEFKDFVRGIVAQEIGHDESEEEAPEGEDLTGMDSDEEEIDINEILAELAQEEEMKEENMEEGLEDWIDKISAKLQKAGRNSPIVQSIEKAVSKYETEKHSGANRLSEGNMEEGLEDWIDKISAKLQKAGRNSPIVQSIEKAVSKYETEKHSGAHKISEEESEELAEALATIKTLRGQLQEVNLLNAKLLYVNKVFKSNNLSENQKVNVIAAFDKAETVKEVKLVFETVSKNVVAKPVQIREHKSFASKPAGTAATTGKKEVISEVSETVKRMQKLAGII
jgi:hypothetical protein